ncbi:hypothetical protein ISO99_02655 [Staphylococcus sp. 18_1_E_LY]|uniref:NERD domain-containing protein n=1 Tax=Staphylococcus lloydii TaxID=2781774 RepID=A0A7T1AYD5_9STAP|nr:hypothetical protein [Staphylococcus lloydii]MBF7018801.1 hypothetical protein [Staphylococcus lloydii]MBF7026529.1 hypothetical protein [Staphylococcus lloydii]QPM74196.1 hypothetical protein ISP08_07515 [Staphylococcus lloydii]
MFLTIILLIIIFLLIIALFFDHRFMQNKLDTETYAKNQLVRKISTVTSENTTLRNQMLNFDANNDKHHHGIRKAKQDLTDIMAKLVDNHQLANFEIISTSNLAVRHPLFEYARHFDYIVITEKGLFNIDVKNWKQKTFYHFNVDPEQESDNSMSDKTEDQIVGRYIANKFHSQFNSTRMTSYTFIERIKKNTVIFDFYSQDPYKEAAYNTKMLQEKIKENVHHNINNVGLVYFTDGSVNLIDGPTEREKYVETVSSKSNLKHIIEETVTSADESLSKEQFDRLVARFQD